MSYALYLLSSDTGEDTNIPSIAEIAHAYRAGETKTIAQVEGGGAVICYTSSTMDEDWVITQRVAHEYSDLCDEWEITSRTNYSEVP